MDYYPLFANLTDRQVVVVGGGEVATRKIEMLLRARASIAVISRKLCHELKQLESEQKIKWLAKDYQPDLLKNAFLVVVATDNHDLNANIATDANNQKKFVNVVDEQPLCSYIVPAIVDRSPLQIAISSSGTAPVLARMIRQKLETEIPQYYADLTRISGQFRQRVKSCLGSINKRRRFWEKLFTNNSFHHYLSSKNNDKAQSLMEESLKNSDDKHGEITLVGAGPGNVDLLTIGGFQAIQTADVVLVDALVSDEIIDLIRRDAHIIDVGKRAGNQSYPQEKINEKLIYYAKKGLRVVRLKGGDSFIFGRGGEECQSLLAENINFKVIPGITAAIGATAYAGIPLTHRDFSQSVTFITGHNQKNYPVDWQAMSKSSQTLVIYMGTINADTIAKNLVKYGRSKTTPVAVISHGTKVNQKTQIGELSNLDNLAKKAPRPALIVIGEVVSVQKELSWFYEQDDLLNEPLKEVV